MRFAGRSVARVLVVMGVLAFSVPSASAAGGTPDLGMAPVQDLRVDKTADGRRLLRYTGVVVNVGQGPFEVRGSRTSVTDPRMQIAQRVYDTSGGFRDTVVSTPTELGGDGHGHWHISDLTSTDLVRADNGVKVGTGVKRGFCFFDNVAYRLSLPGAPQAVAYPGAGCGDASSLTVTMGLSVGWGDAYRWNLPDQYVDITGLVAGRYRLSVTADAAGLFTESQTTNNTTWVDIQLKGQGPVRIVGYGPSA